MKKPVIGITTTCGPDPNNSTFKRLFVNRLYADCIAKAGGIPILLTDVTPVLDALQLIDGLLVPGGEDIDPRHFGQELHPKSVIGDEQRFIYEKSLYETMPENFPYFGICYGCQALNVFRGGDLVQDIPEISDAKKHTGGTLQKYTINQGSLLESIIGDTVALGKSYHHQAVGRLGKSLAISAVAEDGTIEALEDPTKKWIFGVQWHPERTANDPTSVRLFKHFVSECSRYGSGK